MTSRTLAGLARHAERLAFVAFLLGLGFLIFLAGMVAGKFKLPPYASLNAAKDAAVALKDKYWQAEEPFTYPTRRAQGGVVAWDRAATDPGYTLMTGYFGEGQFGARLIDMEGRVVQSWKVAFSDVWPGEAPHIRNRAPDRLVAWHGVRLYPNGDLLFNFQGGNFPGGGGLVRVDKDSRILWKIARNTHHDIAPRADGTMAVVAHNWREDGIPACRGLLDPPYHEDSILTVTEDGQVQGEQSVLGALCRSQYRGLFSITGLDVTSWRGLLAGDDPTHLNNVDVVSPEQAAVFPMARAGDYLLSLRNMNAVGLLDPASGLFRWVSAGQFARQHDPDILPDGSLLVFDNLGGGDRRSRVVAVDPATQAVRWSFSGSDADPLWSEKMGNQQLLPNGNVLITESWGGRLLEVTREAEPRVVWEYVNLLRGGDGAARVGLISQSLRYKPSEVPFLEGRPGPTS